MKRCPSQKTPICACIVRSVSAVVAILVARAVFAITIPTVPVGNPGNPADMRYVDSYHPNGVGAVPYAYRIGKTEITNSQYTVFLNAVAASDPYWLYSPDMGLWGGIDRSGSPGSYSYSVKPPAQVGMDLVDYSYENKPVEYVSSADVMRFANWLHNGQPTGPQDASTTEDGAYTLNGAFTWEALSAVTRNAGARWWLPNEDEWYKAAYHKNDGVTGNYWDFPTGTNTAPNNNLPSSDTGNSANFYDNDYTTGSDTGYPLTDAGAYTLSGSPYGTFDQGGNVFEWNETQILLFGRPVRGDRGGSWQFDATYMHASFWDVTAPWVDWCGFRVASVPEPTAGALLGLAGAVGFLRRRRATAIS